MGPIQVFNNRGQVSRGKINAAGACFDFTDHEDHPSRGRIEGVQGAGNGALVE